MPAFGTTVVLAAALGIVAAAPPPALASLDAHDDGLRAHLDSIGLAAYEEKFRAEGYDRWQDIVSYAAHDFEDMIQAVGLKYYAHARIVLSLDVSR